MKAALLSLKASKQRGGVSLSRLSEETMVNMSHPPQTSSIKNWKDAPTRSVDVVGAKFVYRQLGPTTGVPVIMLNHWGAVLDNFDPRIVDGLAATLMRKAKNRENRDLLAAHYVHQWKGGGSRQFACGGASLSMSQ